MSDSEVDESKLPSPEECEKRCQEFAAITGTDTALAMFYLQDRDWSLDVISFYFPVRKSIRHIICQSGLKLSQSGPKSTSFSDEHVPMFLLFILISIF